jgi:hypothetical protein
MLIEFEKRVQRKISFHWWKEETGHCIMAHFIVDVIRRPLSPMGPQMKEHESWEFEA